MSDVHAQLHEEVRAWQEDHGEVPPPPPQEPAAVPPSSSAQPPPREEPKAEQPAQPSPPTSAKARDSGNAALATLLVAVLDIGLVNFVGARMKLTADEKSELSRLAEPVVDKYLPDDVEIGPEAAFLVGAGFMLLPKYLSPEPAKRAASPAGGTPQAVAGSGGQPTSATVDGKPVAAEVLA